MGLNKLNKYTVGQLISIVDERNSFGITDFYGININKEFMPTVADTEGLDETKYKVVRKNRFVFSGMQTGRDMCIRISMYNSDKPIIVSPAYTTFEVSATDIVIPLYFFMLFLTHEKDRLGAFYSDGSIRSNLDWDRFCDIELELPSIDIQQKYVDIYTAMLANQQNYERGLDDLKLVCDSLIENLQSKFTSELLGNFIHELSVKDNDSQYSTDSIRGVSIKKEFIETKADVSDLSTTSYKIVKKGQFAFNPNTARMGDKFSIALNNTDDVYLVSSIYPVFEAIDSSKLDPNYLMLFFKRDEFDRYVRFNSWGSAREMFNYDDMANVCIPIPDIEVQKSIAKVFSVYNNRLSLKSEMKNQIINVCPVLIRGALKEAKNI